MIAFVICYIFVELIFSFLINLIKLLRVGYFVDFNLIYGF